MAATAWDTVKTILPNGNEVAYIFQLYRNINGQCTPNQLNVGMQCSYLAGVAASPAGTNNNDSWSPGMPMEGIFPNVGEFVSLNVTQPSGVQYAQCYKCVEIVDKNTFLTGTCTSCYNEGYGGQCSDAFITVPPYPGDSNGCRYDNSVNSQGIVVGFFSGLGPWTFTGSWVTYISPDCVDCTTPSPPPPPPNSTLNFLQNCCDPSEQYQFNPTSGLYDQLVNIMAAVDTNAFIADLYIGGASTGQKCWSIGTQLQPQLIPFAYFATFQNTTQGIFTNCQQLQNYVQNNPTIDNCCGTPQTEWCCLTGVAGPPTTCTQVALGTCNPAVISNYSAGPFQSQNLCLDAGCATVAVPPYECEPPVAALIDLQAKVKGFSDRRKHALSEPNADLARETAFKKTNISKISPGTKIKSDSDGGNTATRGNQDQTNNRESSSGGGERPAPSTPYVGGGGY